MYRELIEKSITSRGVIVETGKIFPSPSNYTRYASLFMFGKEILTHVKANGSVKGYKGKIYSEAIWIDIDCDEDTDKARLSTIALSRKLNIEYQINPDDLFIYFSGNKGFHVAIFNKFLGFDHTTPISAEKVKDFVGSICEGIPHIDLIIYEPVRIFRIENSRHEKTGLYKVRISYEELQCQIEDIKKLASSPRSFKNNVRIDQISVNPGLSRVWQDSGNYVQELKEIESSGNLFAPPKEGSRNKTLLVQACTLFRKSELSSSAIYDIVSNAAQLSSLSAKDPINQQEVKRIILNAERLVGDERKKTIAEDLKMKSFGEWIPEWESYVLQEQTTMTLCFHDINEVMKGRLRGKLGVLMGYGGAKKSLYALNIVLRNNRISEDISLYSTMEMGVPQLINRIIDHEASSTDGRNAHEAAAQIFKSDINEGRKYLIGELGQNLGNKLQIIANSRMTYQGYKTAIQKCRETIGIPLMLVVDGLSMMGGKGTETELYSQNSADLKQLANEENIFVLLICHVSKGADRHTRDLSRHIRGSEKILDNCDFYATLSQIQELGNPETYRQDIGFINFVDKRGSGRSVDIVYSFDGKRLRLGESTEDPKLYYESIRKTRREENAF